MKSWTFWKAIVSSLFIFVILAVIGARLGESLAVDVLKPFDLFCLWMGRVTLVVVGFLGWSYLVFQMGEVIYHLLNKDVALSKLLWRAAKNLRDEESAVRAKSKPPVSWAPPVVHNFSTRPISFDPDEDGIYESD